MKIIIVLAACVLTASAAPRGDSVLCGVCTSLVGAAENLGIKDEASLVNMADSYCAKLGEDFLVKLCDGAVKFAVPALLNYIKNDFPPQTVCADVGLCSSSMVAADLSESVRSGPFCQYCEMGINTVKQLLENYVPNVVNDVEGLCNKLPGEEGQICTMLVKNYLQMLMDKLIGMLDADKTCAAMKLCDGTSTVTRQTGAVALAQLDINWGTVECNFCKMLFEFVENNLLGDNVEQTIFQGLEKICQDLPNQSYQQTCIDILGSYGPMIINYLKSLISPDHVCPIIKMCS